MYKRSPINNIQDGKNYENGQLISLFTNKFNITDKTVAKKNHLWEEVIWEHYSKNGTTDEHK